mgnify:CR=1 FL=1
MALQVGSTRRTVSAFLLTHSSVLKAQVRVDHVVLSDQDEVVEAAAGAETELVDHLQIAHETEGARRHRRPDHSCNAMLEEEAVVDEGLHILGSCRPLKNMT